LPDSQATHAAPLAPQSAFDVPGWQFSLASQQPVGQLVALHTQEPLTHASPAGQLVGVQEHEPPMHSCPVGHATQAAPFAPHCAAVGGVTHDVPLQQPVGQSVELQYGTQLCPVHSLPALHATHAAPPVPQSALAVPGWQLPLVSQQPAGQVVALQPHTPLMHSAPVAHAMQAAPPTPHSVFNVPATQDVPSQQPVVQFVQSPAHCWLVHSLPALHATQAAPPLPHFGAAVPGWQVPLASQQPVGQLLALHAASSSSSGDASSLSLSLSSSSTAGRPLEPLLLLPPLHAADKPITKPSNSANANSENVLAFIGFSL
jgi:hypothetical protein